VRQGRPVQHPRRQPAPQQLEHPPIRDPFADKLHQDLPIKRVEEAADVGVDHPAPSAHHFATDDLHRVVR
jgi:hypothetical protein